MITEIYNYLLEQVLHNQFAQGGIIIGLLSSSLYYLRFIPLSIYNMIKRKIVYTVYIGTDSLYYDYFNRWLYEKYKNNFRNVKLLGDEYKSNLEQYVDNFIIWYKNYPIRIVKSVEKLEGANNIYQTEIGKFTLSTLFNKDIIDGLIKEVAEHTINRKIEKQKSHAYVWSNSERWNYFKTFDNVGLDSVIIQKELKDSIINAYNNWVESKAILAKKGKALGLTYFLYGPLVAAKARWRQH